MSEQVEVVKTHSIAKILRDADGLPTIAEKVAYLKKYGSNQLQEIVRHVFDAGIKYGVSTTPTPCDPLDYSRETNNNPTLYRQQPDNGVNDGILYFEIRKRLIYLIEGGPGDVMTQAKRDDLFKDILEAVNPDDAELLLAVKDKQWPYESLTPTVLNEAFPNLVSLSDAVAAVVPKAAKAPRKRAPAKKTAKKAAPRKKATKKTA